MRGFLSFWRRSIVHAFSFGWIVFGAVSTFLPAVILFIQRHFEPLAAAEWLKWLAEYQLEVQVCAAAGFALAYLAYAPYRLYRERDREAKVAEAEIERLKINEFDMQDRVLLACVDALKRGLIPIAALMDAKADELHSNDEVLYVCDQLRANGHADPVRDVLECPREHYLAFLRSLRLSPITQVNDYTEVHMWLLNWLVLKQPSPTRDKEGLPQSPAS